MMLFLIVSHKSCTTHTCHSFSSSSFSCLPVSLISIVHLLSRDLFSGCSLLHALWEIPFSSAEKMADAEVEPQSDSYEKLCTTVKGLVPEAVGTETWYLIIVSPLPVMYDTTSTSGDLL
jgi:hypothetical protein